MRQTLPIKSDSNTNYTEIFGSEYEDVIKDQTTKMKCKNEKAKNPK